MYFNKLQFLFIPSNWFPCLSDMTPVVFDSLLTFWYIPSSCTFLAPILETDIFFLRSLISCGGKLFCALFKWILSQVMRASQPEHSQHSQTTDGSTKSCNQHINFYFFEQKLPSYYRICQVKCIQYNLHHILTHY